MVAESLSLHFFGDRIIKKISLVGKRRINWQKKICFLIIRIVRKSFLSVLCLAVQVKIYMFVYGGRSLTPGLAV